MLEFKLIYGNDGYTAAKSIREEVFISEQGFSLDYDEKDLVSWHVCGIDNGNTIAAARLFEKSRGIFTIGRVAVKKEYRGQYIGDTLMRILEDKAVALSGHTIELSANENAVDFYEKQGYEKSGESYFEEHVRHIAMIKDLTKPFKKCSCCKKTSQTL